MAPYRVSAPRRGIIGNSRYAQALRKDIVRASRDPRRTPVIVFGEPGLQKNNIAALIHFGSPFGRAPLVQVDCDRLDDDASELFGRGAKRGLLAWLPHDGTLILNNIHQAPPAVRPLLEQEVATASLAASMDLDDADVDAAALAQPLPRIIMTAETRVTALETHARVIKVPPLRVRPEDIDEIAIYLLRVLARQRGLGPLTLTPAASECYDSRVVSITILIINSPNTQTQPTQSPLPSLTQLPTSYPPTVKRLEAGQYANNVAELQAAVERAVAQATQPQQGDRPSADANVSRVIGEEVFWFATQVGEGAGGREREREREREFPSCCCVLRLARAL